jgi:hypothetical protein
VLLCFALRCFALLCVVVLCCVVLYCVVLCCVVLCCVVLCCVVLCCVVLCCVVLCCVDSSADLDIEVPARRKLLENCVLKQWVCSVRADVGTHLDEGGVQDGKTQLPQNRKEPLPDFHIISCEIDFTILYKNKYRQARRDRPIYRPAPKDKLGWEGRLSASYLFPCLKYWLLPFQVSSLKHKVL